MPEERERKLREEAEKKFPGDNERQDHYVYGTMQKMKQANHWYWRKRGKKQ